MAVYFMVSGFSLGPLILLQLVPLWLLIWGALTVCALLIVLFVALSVKKYQEARNRNRSPQEIDILQVLNNARRETTECFKRVVGYLSRVLQHSSFGSEFRFHGSSPMRGRTSFWQTWLQGNATSARRKSSQKLEDIALKIQKIPTEEYLDPQKLHELKPKELIAALTSVGISSNTRAPREKEELVAQLREKILASHTDSSSTSCSICLGEYEHGDILRITPCKHRFHLECIDQWAFSATDFSRPVACPLCNSDL